MNKYCLLSLFIILLNGLIISQTGAAPTLASVDRLITFTDTDFSAEYQIVKKTPGGGSSTTTVAMFRRDKTAQFLVLILQPEIDKGKGYLKTDNNLWLYDPVNRSFAFTSAKERFENSGMRISDFSGSTLALDYAVTSEKKEKLGKFDCTVLEIKATNDSVSFARKKLWISTEGLIRKVEDYSLSGQLMRTTAIPTYQKIDTRSVPLTFVILEHLKFKIIAGKTEYEQTTVSVSKPSLQKLPDTVYTKEYLEKVNSK